MIHELLVVFSKRGTSPTFVKYPTHRPPISLEMETFHMRVIGPESTTALVNSGGLLPTEPHTLTPIAGLEPAIPGRSATLHPLGWA